MNYKNFVYTSAIVMATLLTFGVGKATAQTTANGPYYAWPSWDQQLPASTRFIVLSNWKDTFFPSGGAAVLDRETGLVWERSPLAIQLDWQTASNRCVARRTGNRGGWRLPTVNELASLFDPSVTTAPHLPSGHPFTDVPVSATLFWTATPFSTTAHRVVGYDSLGLSLGGISNSEIPRPWCVRGGFLAGPQ